VIPLALRNQPKLALYLPSLRGGGAERVTVKLAHGLAERGVAVDLVLAKAEGPFLAEARAHARVIDLGARRVIASLPQLVEYFRREKPDTMMSVMGHANIVALWAKRIARVPTRLVISERNTWQADLHSKVSRERVFLLLKRRFYPWADGIVAVSDGVAEQLSRTARLPRGRITVIYNPVVRPQLTNKARQALEDPWLVPNEPPVVLAVGRLTRQKDYPTLLRAFASLRERRQARLLILGEGEVRAELERLVRNMGMEQDVRLPGYIANPYAYMARAGVFVLSSAWEGLPGVLIEAMACGCPVVSTDCPSGPVEILDGGRFGRLVAVGDAPGMATAIALALDQGRGDATRAAQERAMIFNVERATSAYHAVLLPNTGYTCGLRGYSVQPDECENISTGRMHRGGLTI
jgi:glycosyltransferase involved in cell wall biosynthesis